MKRTCIFSIMLLCWMFNCASTYAKDVISFTTKPLTQSIYAEGTTGKSYSVNWGDGTIETYQGNARLYHTYATVKDYDVTITAASDDCRLTSLDVSYAKVSVLDVSKATALTSLSCSNALLTSLDVSANTALTQLYCSFNGLTSLDLRTNSALTQVYCTNNKLSSLTMPTVPAAFTGFGCTDNLLSLSSVYNISLQDSTANIGSQPIPLVEASLNTEYTLSPDLVLGGVNTVFSIKKSGIDAVPETDYTLENGKVVFKTTGIYTVKITNAAIKAYYEIQGLYVVGTVENQKIAFTWEDVYGWNSFSVTVTPQKSYTINWGDGSAPEVFTATNYMEFPGHAYAQLGTYTVTMTGNTVDCMFSDLDLYRSFITNVDLSGASELVTFTCGYNNLTSLDVSKNTALVGLYVENNQIASLDLSANTQLKHGRFAENALTIGNLYQLNQLPAGSGFSLDEQLLPTATVALNTEYVLTTDVVLGADSSTVFVVEKPGELAILNTDYTLTDGKIVFLNSGIYTVKMTNGAITKKHSVSLTIFAGTIENQAISFSWNAAVNASKIFSVNVAKGEPFTVDFGDGTSEAAVGKGQDVDYTFFHSYTTAGTKTVTITGGTPTSLFYRLAVKQQEVSALDVTKAIMLTHLECSGNQISSLDMSKNKLLAYFFCSGNHLPNLSLNSNSFKAMRQLNCSSNKLPLAVLYALLQEVDPYMCSTTFGQQVLFTKDVALNTATAATADLVINGENTVFEVKTIAGAIVDAADYAILNGEISFSKPGIYQVKMKNAAIAVNHEVIALYTAGTIAEQKVSFTWRPNPLLTPVNEFGVTTFSPKQISVNWGDASATETQTGKITGNGNLFSHRYARTGTYTVTVTGSEANSILQMLNLLGNTTVTAIDVTGASELLSLDCQGAKLTTLDLSQNKQLLQLYCSTNQLTALDLTGNENLGHLDCSLNKIATLDLSKNTALQSCNVAGNQLPLSQLYPIWNQLQLIWLDLSLEAQQLPLDSVFLNKEVTITQDLVFMDNSYWFTDQNTEFSVSNQEGSSQEDVDYVLDAATGKITFLTEGLFVVSMSNNAIFYGNFMGSNYAYVLKGYRVTKDPNGIEENVADGSSLTLYPNPTHGVIKVSTAGGEIPEVKIYNLNGQLLNTYNSEEIDLSAYKPGVYVAKSGAEVVKVIKK